VAEDARDTEEETDGRVGAHGAKRVRPDPQKRREPQGTEDEADEAAEQSDHPPRPDPRPHADSVRSGRSFAPLRAKQVDPEDEKGEADDDQQCVTGYHTRQEASDHGADHRRWGHPRKQPPVDPAGPNVGDRGCERGNRRDSDVRAGPRRRARGRCDEHREPDVPEHEAHETAHQRGREAPEPDEDEDESVQALEYPL